MVMLMVECPSLGVMSRQHEDRVAAAEGSCEDRSGFGAPVHWKGLGSFPQEAFPCYFFETNFPLTQDFMTARVKKVIEDLAELSPPEMAELVSRFRELGAVNNRGERAPCRNADLIRFFESHTPDPEFADDIEVGIRERRARAEDRTSPWDR